MNKPETAAAAGGGWRVQWLHPLPGDALGGLMATLIAIPHAMGLGLLAFAALGPDWAPVGVIAGILSCIVGCVVSGVMPSGTCQVMGTRTAVTVVFAGILAALAVHPALQGPHGPDVPRVLTLAFIAVFMAGLLQTGFGLLRLGRAIKFVPYPVLAGFMNGIALLLIYSQIVPALGVDSNRSLSAVLVDPSLIRPGSLLVAAVVVAATLLAPRLTRRLPVLLCGLLVGVPLHYLLASLVPGSVGPLVGTLPLADFAPRELVSMFNFTARDDFLSWLVFLLPGALLLAGVAALDGLLAAVVTDPVTRSRHDSDRLLKAQGAAAAVAAAFGAIPPAASTHTRVAGYLSGGRTPRCALFHALFMALALFALAPLIARIPVAALAGVIIYTALTLFDRWSHDLLRRFSASGRERREILFNLAVVVSVALAMLAFNLMVAFAVGMAGAVFLLLIKLSGSPVWRALDGSIRSSLKLRSPDERAMLQPLAQRICVFEMEGAIFFGTADQLQVDVEALPGHSRYLILDFRRVTEIDASGAKALQTICQTAADRNLQVVLSHLREDEGHGRALHAFGIPASIPVQYWFADLDRALEWCEDSLLGRERYEDQPEVPVRGMALFAGMDDAEISVFERLLERHELAHGDMLFREGDPGDRLYLLARGAVSIKLSLGRDGRARRLATFVPGVFFGEAGLMDGEPRSADAFAKGERVVLYSLTAQALDTVLREQPQLGVKFYRNLSREMSQRLRITSGALRALE
ncbi:MAG: SulP family inorganic anion transporter [Betaproteobacteria bacterium]